MSNLKLSKYNIAALHDDGTVLYNQITGSLVLLDSEDAALLESASKGGSIDEDFGEFLAGGGFAIRADVDELSWMESVYLDKARRSDFKSLTITPTDRCNLDCAYCYEHKSDWHLMSDDEQAKVEAFTERFLSSTPTKHFHVTWFGGEPTLHIEAAERLSRFFAAQCDAKGIRYDQYMVTNGTLLSASMRQRLKDIGCTALQITVDGPQAEHDSNRPFRRKLTVLSNESASGCGSGGGCGSAKDKHAKSSFQTIMQYLPDLKSEGFQVNVRVNVNEQNMDSFWKLADDLHSRSVLGPSHDGMGMVSLYPARMFEFDKLVDKEAFAVFSREAGARKIPGMLKSRLSSFTGEMCLAHNQYALGISQNGNLSKCWRHITNEEFVVGSIEDLSLAERGVRTEYSPLNDPECRKCHVLPSCFGGCLQQNEYFERGYEGDKYAGCESARWDIHRQVLELYESLKDTPTAGITAAADAPLAGGASSPVRIGGVPERRTMSEA